MSEKDLNVKILSANKERTGFDFPLEEIEIKRGYLKDALGSAYLNWEPSRAVIISCQTGSGKTSFCEDVLIADAIKKGKKIVLLSNRLSLNIAEKKRILKKFNIENIWNEQGLRAQSNFGDYITICTYQKLKMIISEPGFAENVEYIVMDEAHYFLTDSGFSTTPSYLLKKIPQIFKMAKRIYISATIDEILPYICKYECLAGSARYKIKFGWSQDFYSVLRIVDDGLRSQEFRRCLYAPNFPGPILYKMPMVYDFVDLHFFEDDNLLVSKIQESKSKWLIFVTSKEKGNELKEQISDSTFIDASCKESDDGYFDALIDKEEFEEKVLITTSVFINGNNLFDDELRNIVVYHLDETSIKQALGRKRRRIESVEKVALYLKIPNKKLLNSRLIMNQKLLDIADKADGDPAFLSRLLLTESHNVEMVKRVIFPDRNGCFHFAKMCLEKMKNDNVLYENLVFLLDQNNRAYCREVASYFEIDFNDTMLEKIDSKEDAFDNFAERAIADSPMPIEKYRLYVNDFNTIRKKFGLISSKDNFGVNRPLMTPRTFNERAEEIAVNLRVSKNNEEYLFSYNIADSVSL